MSVVVTSITFDNSRGQPGSYTVPLRFNEAEAVLLPEWRLGILFLRLPPTFEIDCRRSRSSLLAFPVTGGESHYLEIRARAQPDAGAFQLLPDLPPLRIGFNTYGDSGWCAFPLDTTSFWLASMP